MFNLFYSKDLCYYIEECELKKYYDNKYDCDLLFNNSRIYTRNGDGVNTLFNIDLKPHVDYDDVFMLNPNVINGLMYFNVYVVKDNVGYLPLLYSIGLESLIVKEVTDFNCNCYSSTSSGVYHIFVRDKEILIYNTINSKLSIIKSDFVFNFVGLFSQYDPYCFVLKGFDERLKSIHLLLDLKSQTLCDIKLNSNTVNLFGSNLSCDLFTNIKDLPVELSLEGSKRFNLEYVSNFEDLSDIKMHKINFHITSSNLKSSILRVMNSTKVVDSFLYYLKGFVY